MRTSCEARSSSPRRSIRPRIRWVTFGKTLHELAGRRVGVERPAVDGGDLAAVVDRRDLAVGCKPERDGALGDGVGELAPRVDELVEVLVERLERPSEDVPVQLLSDQREVDELDERRLELAPDLLALVLSQRRQVCFRSRKSGGSSGADSPTWPARTEGEKRVRSLIRNP